MSGSITVGVGTNGIPSGGAIFQPRISGALLSFANGMNAKSLIKTLPREKEVSRRKWLYHAHLSIARFQRACMRRFKFAMSDQDSNGILAGYARAALEWRKIMRGACGGADAPEQVRKRMAYPYVTTVIFISTGFSELKQCGLVAGASPKEYIMRERDADANLGTG